MSTERQKKTDCNFVSEKGQAEVEVVNPNYQPSLVDLEEDNVP